MRGGSIVRCRSVAYQKQRNLKFSRLLGTGKDGVVHEMESNAFPGFVAVKSFYGEAAFARERDVYLRLRELRVHKVRLCNAPQMLAWDDALLTIEMTLVQPPFILDFADAWLDDDVPEFSEEVWADCNRKLDEDFDEHAGEVRRILAVLRSYGILLLDVHPGNIRFR